MSYTYRFTGDLPVVIVTPVRNYDVSHGDVIESDTPLDNPLLEELAADNKAQAATKGAPVTTASTEAPSESSAQADATEE